MRFFNSIRNKKVQNHKIEVFDQDGNFLCYDEDVTNIIKIVRCEHKINGEICYSYNNYLSNGMISYGMILNNGFNSAKMY